MSCDWLIWFSFMCCDWLKYFLSVYSCDAGSKCSLSFSFFTELPFSHWLFSEMTELLSWLSKDHSAQKKRLVQTDCFCLSVILSCFLVSRRQTLDKERPCRRLTANFKIEKGLQLFLTLFLLLSHFYHPIWRHDRIAPSASPPKKTPSTGVEGLSENLHL